MANRTILVDNNTWNNTHISRVGQAMASDEQHAYEIMRELDVDYVLGRLQNYIEWQMHGCMKLALHFGRQTEGPLSNILNPFP